jgi:Arc/MetJ-type ribon-helix-helix transcriptional regulator
MTSPERTTGQRTRTVEIPDRTASEISKRLQGTEFESVDAYVEFALDQLLRELDRLDDDARSDSVSVSDTGDATNDGVTDEAVSDRLESLGYL